MSWDWSKAGERQDGKPIKKMQDGRPVYDGMKGVFRWEKNVKPEYYWYNGVMRNVLLTDKIDPGKVTKLNYPDGNVNDPKSRIYPFKVHNGKGPYDKVHKTMVVPKIFGPKGSGAYWGDYDWKTAITKGMEYAGLPFSGSLTLRKHCTCSRRPTWSPRKKKACPVRSATAATAGWPSSADSTCPAVTATGR